MTVLSLLELAGVHELVLIDLSFIFQLLFELTILSSELVEGRDLLRVTETCHRVLKSILQVGDLTNLLKHLLLRLLDSVCFLAYLVVLVFDLTLQPRNSVLQLVFHSLVFPMDLTISAHPSLH